MLEERERDWFQIVAIFTASLSYLMCGVVLEWTSPSIPKLTEDKLYNISQDQASYLNVIHSISAAISSFPISKLNDVIGRKYTLLSSAFPYITAMLIIANTKSVYLLYLSRFMSGLGDGCAVTSISMYIGEIATPKVRGVWGNTITFSLYVGYFLVNVLGNYMTIVKCAYVTTAIPLLFLFTFSFMPESPYFYLMKGRTEDARASLQKLRRMKNVQLELETLKSDVSRQMSESGNWKDLFFMKSNRKALLAAVFLRISQQLNGVSVIAVYITYIFIKAETHLAAEHSAVLHQGLSALFIFVSGLFSEKLGRKGAFSLSLLLSAFVLLGESVYFFLQFNTSIDLNSFRWIPLAGLILYVMCISFGVAILPNLMLSELFSASVKTKGVTLLTVICYILLGAVSEIFHLLDRAFGLTAPFLFFSLCSFISAFLTDFFIPETKNKSLEEIQLTFNYKN